MDEYPDGAKSSLLDSQGIREMYTNALQEQSFSPQQIKGYGRGEASTSKSISVMPEEVVFDEVVVPNSSLASSSLTPKMHTKVQLRNMLSAPIELTLKSSCPDKLKLEPQSLTLSAFESASIKVWLNTAPLQKYKKPCRIKEYILIKTDFFDQKVNVTINMSAEAREKSLESSVNSMSYRRQMGGGFTNALSKLRSLSRDIKDQKKRGHLEDGSKAEGMLDSGRAGRTQVDIRKGQRDSELKFEQKHNNLTASFNQEDFEGLARVEKNQGPPPFGKQFSIADLETSNLRADLDESALDDYEDIQRSNNHEDDKNELNLNDMTQQLDGRDPNDQSLSLQQLEHSQYTYSKTKSHLTQNNINDYNQMSQLSQMEQTERIGSLQSEIKGYQKIINKQQATIKDETRKREQMQIQFNASMNNEGPILAKIQQLLHSEEPDLEELLSLSLKQDRDQQAAVQAQKDQQVLSILKQKDNEIQELHQEVEILQQQKVDMNQKYKGALMQVDKLMAQVKNEQLRKSSGELENWKSKMEKMQKEHAESERQYEDVINQLNSQLDQKESQVSNLQVLNKSLQDQISELQSLTLSDQKVEENQILVAELERVENDKTELQRRNQEITEQFRTQTKMLQEKLSRSYQDIQKMVHAQAGQDMRMKGLPADPSEDGGEYQKKLKEQGSQTDVDLQQFHLLLRQELNHVENVEDASFSQLDEKYLHSNQHRKASCNTSVINSFVNLKDSDKPETLEQSRQRNDAETYIKCYRESLVKQAEIDYDSRQKLRDENIKRYFDTQVMRHLASLNTDEMGNRTASDEDTIELTRQFCDLQLQLDAAAQQIAQLRAQVRGHEAHIEVLKTRGSGSEEVQRLRREIDQLNGQKQLELELLKSTFEREIQEEKNELRRQLEWNQERTYQGVGLQDLQTENQKLHDRESELYAQNETLRTELAIIEKKFEDERFNQTRLEDEIRAYKDSIQDIQRDLCEPLHQLSFQPTDGFQTQDELNSHPASCKAAQQQNRNVHSTQSQSSNARPSSRTRKGQAQNTSKQQLKQTRSRGNLNERRGSSVESEDNSGISAGNTCCGLNNPMLTNRSNMSAFPNATSENGEGLFTFNPPRLVSQLIEAKLYEKKLKLQMAVSKQNEADARQEVRKVLIEAQGKQHDVVQRQLLEEKVRRSDLEARVRELELQSFYEAQSRIATADSSQGHFGSVDRHGQQSIPQRDYALLANTVVHLINKEMAATEGGFLTDSDIQSVKEQDSVYKLVIFQLTKKLQSMLNPGEHAIDQYIPAGAKNQKIWYLELLESQLNTAESMVNKLYDFVKRLQIDIQGCLTSAAQIKATSLDLASNTNETLQEIKLLKNVAQLIRSDLESMSSQPTAPTKCDETLARQPNPFMETSNLMQQTSLDLQSQLGITQQVKTSLEKELVSLKRTLFDSKSQYRDELNVLANQNQQLEAQLQNLERETVAKLRGENSKLVKQLGNLQTEHKSLANSAIKELDQKEQEIEKLKLRYKTKNEKGNEAKEAVAALKEERQKDLEAWTQEKQQLDRTIIELEEQLREQQESEQQFQVPNQPSEQPNSKGTIEQQVPDELAIKLKAKVLKLKKKLQEKADRVKELEPLETELRKATETSRLLQGQVDQLDIQCREGEILLRTQEQSLKQLHLEKKLILGEKQSQAEATSGNSKQIQNELDSLRESFASCLNQMMEEMNKTQKSESQWKGTVIQLKQTVEELQGKLGSQKQEQQQKLFTIEAKDEQLSSELRLLRNENMAIKQDNKTLFERLAMTENSMHEKEESLNLHMIKLHETNRQKMELENQLGLGKEHNKALREELTLLEIKKDHSYEEFGEQIEEVKGARQSLCELYENQLEILRNKLLTLQTATKGPGAERDVDLTFTLSQREALVKNLKKEVSTLKAQNSKYKTKQTDLKKQLSKMEQPSSTKASDKHHKDKVDPSLENKEFMNLVEKAQSFNLVQQKMVEAQASKAKTEGWNIVLLKQTQDQEQTIAELRWQSEELQQQGSKEAKLQKNNANQSETIKALKQEMKAQEAELVQIKQTWMAPDRQKADAQLIKDLQLQSKSLKEEAARKRDLIQNFKTQKEALEKDKKEVVSELQSLKEEHTKLSKQIKASSQAQTSMKQIKQEQDSKKELQTQLENEIQALSQKLKNAKSEVQRKDQMIKDLKNEKPSSNQESKSYIAGATDREVEGLAEENKKKIRELKQKHKVDLEIKDNLVRCLKLKVEQQQELMEDLKDENHTYQEKNMNMPLQVQHNTQLEKQQKKDKSKVKKYDLVVKKSLAVLAQLSRQLATLSEQMGANHVTKDKGDAQIDEAHYRDSVDILGVSMSELEQYMNPGKLTQSNIDEILFKFKQIGNEADEISTYITKKGHDSGLRITEEMDQVREYCCQLIESIAKASNK